MSSKVGKIPFAAKVRKKWEKAKGFVYKQKD
jgi:hypothetical protein